MVHAPAFVSTPPNILALDRIGDQIAELSAHLERYQVVVHVDAPALADPEQDGQ